MIMMLENGDADGDNVGDDDGGDVFLEIQIQINETAQIFHGGFDAYAGEIQDVDDQLKLMLLKCNFDENEDNHRWHNIKPVDAVRVVIMTMSDDDGDDGDDDDGGDK